MSDPASLTISGNARAAIMPGVMQRLDVTLDNLSDVDLSIDRITVTVEGVDAPESDVDHPCGAADFFVRHLSGGVAFVLEDSHTDSLSGLGVAQEHWPAVGMLDRPINQDGCKGAHLTLGYEASGVEVQR